MALNINNIGRKVAVINDSKKYKNLVFSVSEDDEDDGLNKPFQDMQIKEGTFQFIPDTDRDRDTIFICGAAGSGKSYWAAQYIKQYTKYLKDYPIYLISEGTHDPAFEKLEIKRIKVDNEFISDPIPFTDFEKCLVIFDDIDAFTGKLKKAVYELLEKLLKNARKNKVSVIMTSHGCTGLELKPILNEADTIVFFPRNYNRSLKYLLENYVGLTTEYIKKLFKHKSRWCAFVKSYPNIILMEKYITTLTKLQDF
jgi:hypothetical protein